MFKTIKKLFSPPEHIAKELQDIVIKERINKYYPSEYNFWSKISKHHYLSEDFIIYFKNKLIWYYLFDHQKITDNIVDECFKKINWKEVRFQYLSEECLEKYSKNIDWWRLSWTKDNISEDFIERHLHEFSNNWSNLTRSLKFSERFIRKYHDKVDWKFLSYSHNLSENLIRDYKYKVHWSIVSRYQNISEDFILEFQDKVNWINIFKYKVLSDDFVKSNFWRIKEIDCSNEDIEDIEYIENRYKEIIKELEPKQKNIFELLDI